MTKSHHISETILIEFAKTASVKTAIDAVLGAGTYERIASDTYDALREKKLPTNI